MAIWKESAMNEPNYQTSLKYKVIDVHPDSIVSSPRQPHSRVQSCIALSHLEKSIKDHGLQSPPIVWIRADGTYETIDGHRRIACMRSLNYPSIPVMPVSGDPDKLFAQVSGQVAKMKAIEWVEVFLAGGAMPGGTTATNIRRLNETMGREFLQKLVEKKRSPQIWNVCSRVVKYISLGESEKPVVLNWLLENGTREVASHITNDNGSEEMRNAMKENRLPEMGRT